MVSPFRNLKPIDRLDIKIGKTYMLHFVGMECIVKCKKIKDGGYWGSNARSVPLSAVISGGGTKATEYEFYGEGQLYGGSSDLYGDSWFLRHIA